MQDENQPTGVAAEAPAQAPVQEEVAAAPEAAAPEAAPAPETDTPAAPAEEAAEPEAPEAAASEEAVTLVDAVLVTDWSEHKAGDTIKVTPTKKADLIAQGHVAAE